MATNPSQKRRRGLFGAPAHIAPQQPPQAQVGRRSPQEQPQGKPGFFGQGGPGRAIAGTVGDFLLQHNDMAPIYAPQMQQQQAIAAQQAAEQRKRAMELADYEAKQQIAARYDTQKPTTLRANYEWLVSQGREKEANDLINRNTQNVQWVRADNGDGTFTMVPVGGEQRQRPTKPVGGLRPMGGTGGNVGGGFPGR